MDPIEKALAHLDLAVEKLDEKTKKAAVPKGTIRQIVHRGPDHRILYVDTMLLGEIPESER